MRWAFLSDHRGSAAVEFGLIAPVLAAMLVGVVDGASLLLKYNTMRTAVSSGAQYVMSGGQDLPTARSISMTAWKSAPSNADVTVAKTCECGPVQAVCTALCPDQTVPLAFITLTATANASGAITTHPLSAAQVVRVR